MKARAVVESRQARRGRVDGVKTGGDRRLDLGIVPYKESKLLLCVDIDTSCNASVTEVKDI
jgi:hypothetical protein